MKTIKLLLLTLLFVSCSADSVEEDCNCTKETYTIEQGVGVGQNGLPILTFDKVILSSETVECQLEQEASELGNNTFFDIKCN